MCVVGRILFGLDSSKNKFINDHFRIARYGHAYHLIDSNGSKDCYDDNGLLRSCANFIKMNAGDIIKLCFKVSDNYKYGQLSCNYNHGKDIIIARRIDLNYHTFNIAISKSILGNGTVEVGLIDFETNQKE